MILDEPLAGLDPVARDDVVALLARLRAGGMTIVIISHDFASLGQLCTRRVRLADGTLVPDPAPGYDPAGPDHYTGPENPAGPGSPAGADSPTQWRMP